MDWQEEFEQKLNNNEIQTDSDIEDFTELETITIQINEDVLTKISELDPNKVYVFEFDVGDMPITQIYNLCSKVKECTKPFGIKAIFIPIQNGIKKLKISELSNYKEEN